VSPKVERMAFIGGNVPADLKLRLEKVAADNDRDISKELRRAIRAHVEAHESLRTDGEANGGAA
jgi:predicted transcriptional regulator